MQEEAEKILSSMGVKEGHLRNLSIHCRDDAPISPDVVAAYSEGQKSLFDALTAYKSFIKVNGADHLSFSDVPVIFGEGNDGNLHEVISGLTTSFFEAFLSAEDNSLAFAELIEKEKDSFTVIDKEGYEKSLKK